MRDYDIESDLKQEKFQSIKLVQGDRGNKIKINVYEDGQPVNLAGCSVTAKYKRADGEVVDGTVENKTDNYFYAVMDNNITKVAGTLKMLFNIENGDVKVSTFLLLADIREGIGENTGSSGGDTEVTVDLKDYQKKTDNGLETKNKYIVGAINEVNSQCKDIEQDLSLKSKIRNDRVFVINKPSSTESVADFANFAGQGDSNPPIGWVLHHYTDSIAIQIDNVGHNTMGIMILKNAHNPYRRPDKPETFFGNANFLNCRRQTSDENEVPLFILNSDGNIEKYDTFTIKGGINYPNNVGVEILDIYGARDLFSVRINGQDTSIFKVFEDGINIKNAIDITDNNIAFKSKKQPTIHTDKQDDGMWGMLFNITNKHSNAYVVKNGGTPIISIRNTSNVDYFQIENCMKYSSVSNTPAGLYGNTYYNQTTGYFYAYDKMSDTYKPFNEQYANSAPTTGTWKIGDKIYNKTPVSGGYIGWVCVTAGSPGIWKGFGLIES